jgi:hypothetical protein
MERGCRETIEKLHQRAEGRLSPAGAAALGAHLAACAACRQQASTLESIEAQVRARRRPAPPDFASDVLRRIAREGRTPHSRPRPVRVFAYGLPAAAVLVLALGLSVAAFLLRQAGDSRPGPASGQITVELELADGAARSVAVAGDFNGWDAARMHKGGDGIWRIRLSLPPGRYQYVFVVDDEKWIADPRASAAVDSGYSGTNSVLDVAL